jgi:hypothetical protein
MKKVPALAERNRAIAIADAQAATERESLAAVVGGDSSPLLADNDVRAIIGYCHL